MRYSFRLAELLGHSPDPRRRPGTIKSIVEHTGLDRHQVAALLKNEVKYIPLMALSRLCDYLMENGHCAADQLPGALFSVEPENFWELLARRKRVELCLGVRRPDNRDSLDGAWVVASDSVLLGELLNGVSTLGGTAKYQTEPLEPEGMERHAPPPPHPEQMQQTLVWSPSQDPDDEFVAQARETYDTFAETSGDRGLVCLGSTKSNGVVELILSQAFGCEAFKSQDVEVEKPEQRSVPFFLRYRDDDPHPTSCGAGLKLCKTSEKLAPGIYYETADGSWECCDWDPNSRDAAFVFYIHRESQGRLEMALGGFSGRASRLLAKFLATRAQELWPPVYQGHGMQIGAYIVQFSFSPQDIKSRDVIRGEINATSKVIPIAEQAVQRRVEAIL
jgi:hypothetical protein